MIEYYVDDKGTRRDPTVTEKEGHLDIPTRIIRKTSPISPDRTRQTRPKVSLLTAASSSNHGSDNSDEEWDR